MVGELSPTNITFLKKTFPGKVVSVEGDGEMSLSTSSGPVLSSDGQTVAGPYPGLQLVSPIGTPWVQTTADWAIRRVNARHLPLPESYTFDTLGTGVNAYLIDTGIRFSHDDFLSFPGTAAAAGVSRAAAAVSVFGDDDASDCNGHGTQTASLLGGLAFGIAKNVSLWAVRAVDCDGTTSFSAILQGLEWVAEHHRKPAVVNLSVRSTTDNVALSRALSALSRAHGIPTVVAAGNDGADACSSLPSNASGVLAVGATTPDDARWEGSNWGPCVALYAPGANVIGAGSLSNTDVVIRNGTSLSAPLVAGVLAQLLERQPNLSPQQAYRLLTGQATPVVAQSPEPLTEEDGESDGFVTIDSVDPDRATATADTEPGLIVYNGVPAAATTARKLLMQHQGASS